MKTLIALLLSLAALTFTSQARAECLLYAGSSGSSLVGRVDGNILYDGRSTTPMATLRGDLIYDRTSLSFVLGRIDGEMVYEGRYGQRIWAHFSQGCGGSR